MKKPWKPCKTMNEHQRNKYKLYKETKKNIEKTWISRPISPRVWVRSTFQEAQTGLEDAIEAARVPDLLKALEIAQGMDLPAEPEALKRVELLGQTQGALQRLEDFQIL